MPIQNFLPAFKIGVDICHVPRIARILCGPKRATNPQSKQADDYPERLGGLQLQFLRRLFRPEELNGFEQKVGSLKNQAGTPHMTQVLALHVAGRWEALFL